MRQHLKFPFDTSDNWHIHYHQFTQEPPFLPNSADNPLHNDSEDLLWISQNIADVDNALQLDLGWYDQGTRQKGTYRLVLFRGEWNPIFWEYETQDIHLIYNTIQKILDYNFSEVEGFLHIDNAWKNLSSEDKETYFSQLLSKIFALSKGCFTPEVKQLFHDYAAIDDEFLNWWIEVTLQWAGKTKSFRIHSYLGDIDIEQLVENLNEILGERNRKYHYLNIGDDEWITFN